MRSGSNGSRLGLYHVNLKRFLITTSPARGNFGVYLLVESSKNMKRKCTLL